MAPMAFAERTLHVFDGFRFAVFPRHGGRAPELEQRATLEQLGRYIARLHTVGAAAPFEHRPALTIESFGDESRDFLLAHGFIPDDLRAAWTQHCRPRAAVGAAGIRSVRARGRCACTAIVTAATCCGPTTARISSISMTRGPDRRCRTCGCCFRGTGRRWKRSCGSCSAATNRFAISTARELALIEPLRTLRLIHYSAWLARRWRRSGVSGRISLVQHAALLAGPDPRAARAGRADGRAAVAGSVARRAPTVSDDAYDDFGGPRVGVSVIARQEWRADDARSLSKKAQLQDDARAGGPRGAPRFA